MFWIYDLPNWALCSLCVIVFLTIGFTGFISTRGCVKRIHRKHQSHNEIVSYHLAAVSILYGITLALLAVGAWENFCDVRRIVDREAETLGTLYRVTNGFDATQRGLLQRDLQQYARLVVCVSWPAQRNGQVSIAAAEALDRFQQHLLSPSPAAKQNQVLQSEALSQLNTFLDARGARLNSVTVGMPAAVWEMVLLGALITISVTWFFDVRSMTIHIWMISLTCCLLGLLIFLTAALDHPFRGPTSIGPEAMNGTYTRIMHRRSLQERSCTVDVQERELQDIQPYFHSR